MVMLAKDLTKSELVEILEIIEGARTCVDRPELKRLLLKAAALAEADNTACGIVNVSACGPVDLQTALNASYPAKMFDHYIERKFFLKDPIVRYHANYSITRSWAEIFNEVDDASARQVINYASDFGLKYGLSSGIFMPEEHGVFIVSFAGQYKKSWAHQKQIVDILTRHFGNAMLSCSYGVPVVSGVELVAGELAC